MQKKKCKCNLENLNCINIDNHMNTLEKLFSEIKSDNQQGAQPVFRGIIGDKVAQALDVRKAALVQKRFNESEKIEEAKNMYDAPAHFKKGDKVYIIDSGGDVNFEGVIAGFEGRDQVKVKGTGSDKGKTVTEHGKFIETIADHKLRESTESLEEDDSYNALKDAERAAGGAAAFKKLPYGKKDELLSIEMEKLGYKRDSNRRDTWVKK